MKVNELIDDDRIKYWFSMAKPKESTKETYLYGMQAYTDFVGMSPKQLIEEAEYEIEMRVKGREQKVKQYITNFISELNNKHNAPMTIAKKQNAVRSFYKYHDIVLPELQRRDSAKPLEQHKGEPTKDDIRKVLELSDLLEKAIILVGCSSGLSVNEIINLRVKDFHKGYNPTDEITVLQLRRGKTEYDFITCLTPEASRAVSLYIEYRNRPLSKSEIRIKQRAIDQLYKQKVHSDDDYLFINRHVSNEYLDNRDEELRKLTSDTVQQMYRVLCEQTGLAKPKGVWNLVRSHKMRTWFTNRLREGGCDKDTREFMAAHEIAGSTANYYVGNPQEVKKEYTKCIAYLTIQKALDVSETPEFKTEKQEKDKAIEENAKLKTETEKHKVERQELIDLRSKVERLENLENMMKEFYNERRESLKKPKPLIPQKEPTNSDYSNPEWWDYNSSEKQ